MKYTTIKTNYPRKWNAWNKKSINKKKKFLKKKTSRIHEIKNTFDFDLSVRMNKLNLFGLKLEWLCLLASSVTWRMRSSTATRNFSS